MDRRAPAASSQRHSQDGSFTLANVVVLAIVLVVAALATVLLARTMVTARNINDDAAAIAQSGRGINIATDSVIALNRTNELAAAIRDQVVPLDEDLAAIIAAALDVDDTAGTIGGTANRIAALTSGIDGTAATIDERAGAVRGLAREILASAELIESTAGEIEGTARGINSEAAEIIDVAERIQADVVQINQNLDTTIGLAETILGDTGDILAQARGAHVTAACIDDKLGGGPDGHCDGQQGGG